MPRDLDLNEVTAVVAGMPGVKGVHHAHAWALTTGKNVVSMHVVIDRFEDAEPLLNAIQRLLYDRFKVYFSTVQFETRCNEADEQEAAEINVAAASSERGSAELRRFDHPKHTRK